MTTLLKSKLPVLALRPSLGDVQPFVYPPERDIERSVLIDVAPDREDLLSSEKSIEELRQVLKLRIASPEGHWLYRALTRHEVRLRDATTRLSIFSPPSSDTNDENVNTTKNGKSVQVIRRVLSASSVYDPSRTAMQGIENVLFPSGWPNDSVASAGNVDIWTAPLSTTDKLVSPRLLGPTHILVIYETSPSRIASSQAPPLSPRKAKGFGVFPQVNELPINDLLFLLNLPNVHDVNTGECLPILPRRLHKELPRVLMYVPHLETFPELIVYLHTKNQAELFRKLIPEWLRDLMHPLPVSSSETNNVAINSYSPVGSPNVLRYLGFLISGSTSNISVDTAMTTPLHSETKRTVLSIAEEVMQTTEGLIFEEAENPLMKTATALNALRDNLQHIGYFGKDLWYELDLSHEIVLHAITLSAKLDE